MKNNKILSEKTKLKMLNNRVFGKDFGKGNNKNVGVKWDVVLEIIEEYNKEMLNKITLKEHLKRMVNKAHIMGFTVEQVHERIDKMCDKYNTPTDVGEKKNKEEYKDGK